MKISPFEPHPLIRGGHTQTLVGRYLGIPTSPDHSIHMAVQLPDMDQLILDCDFPASATGETPIVVLMHGLGGCSESAYVLRMSRKLQQRGLRVVRFNHRGCGRRHTTKAKGIYHSGSTNDLLEGLKALSQKWPDAPQLVIGYSLSGTILLNLLGQSHERLVAKTNLRQAATVCAPIDLESSSQALSRWRNIYLNLYYTRVLVRHAFGQKKHFPDLEIPSSLKRLTSLRTFDELFTAIRAGFANRADYYAKCSPQRSFADIRLPTRLIAADDDPIVPTKNVTYLPSNAAAKVIVTRSGGHLGFIAKNPGRYRDRRWLDEHLVDWALAFLVQS